MPKCPKDCKKQNPLIFKKTVIPAIVGNDDITPPENGAFCNMLVVYEATGNAYLYSSDGIPTLLSTTDYTRLNNLPTINGEIILGDLTLEDLGISQLVEAEAEERSAADGILQSQIDAITAASDVVDIVGTYQELEEYDTSKLTENDVIKVLADETVGGATSYYRWENHEWVYIGEEGPYYTKNQTDALLDQKLDVDALGDILDNYYDKAEADALLATKADASALADKQDKLVAGANITIDPATNVIAAIVPSLDNYYTKQETYSQNEVDGLISGVQAQIPTATSQLNNDSGFLTTVPIATSQLLGGIKVGTGLSITQDGTLSADAQHIDIDTALSTTSTNPVENRVITNALNGKANIADIPTVPTNVSAFYNDAGYLTSATVAQNYYNKTETYNKTEVDGFISGVSSSIPTKTSDLTNDGANGTSTYVERSALATVATSGSYNDLSNKPSIPHEMVVLSYGTSTWADFIDAYQSNAVVYCKASSNSNPATGAQNRMAFMAYVSSADSPTSVEFQYVRSVRDKSISQQCDQVYIYTLTNANGGTWSVTVREMNARIDAGAGLTSVYSNGVVTLATSSAIPTKTSDLQNDGSDGTAAYLETDETAYRTTSIPYGVCDGTSTSTVFTATVPGITELRDGVCMWLKNGVVTSVSGFTININNLGAKPVYSNMAAASRDTTLWNIAYTMFFVYDSTRVEGGCWIMYRGYDSNTNTIGYQIRTNSQTLPVTDKFYRYRLLFTSADGTHYVPANTSTSTNATSSRTPNQRAINPFGSIFYYSATTVIEAEGVPGTGTMWEQYPFVFGYSFNNTGAALTLTYPKPVYLKCAPQSDGSAIIDSTTPYVQDLPVTDDDKIYIFLGIAYNATNIELQLDHPIYYHKNGALRLWTNAYAGASVTSYNDLTDKPLINGVTLSGDKSFEDLGSDSLTNLEIDNIINSVV